MHAFLSVWLLMLLIFHVYKYRKFEKYIFFDKKDKWFFLFFQMETKLRELQEKLAVEEADKIQLQNKLHQSLDSEVIK